MKKLKNNIKHKLNWIICIEIILLSIIGVICYRSNKQIEILQVKAYEQKLYQELTVQFLKDSSVTINETEKNVEANNWSELSDIISSDTYTYNDQGKILNRNILNITLKEGQEWKVQKNIQIKGWQNIVLIPEDGKEIEIKRDISYKGSFITNNGILSLGKNEHNGTLTFNGNGKEVEASNSLLEVSNGMLNTYKNITIKNNNSQAKGGGLYINNSTAKIFDSCFDGNEAKIRRRNFC